MKKTFSITIGGHIFMVEEDAFQLLEQYLNSMKQHFAAEKNAEEIMADIESGLAEKFVEKAGSTTVAVTLLEVERAVAVMGHVDEIEGEEEQKEKQSQAGEGAAKRLYRNPKDMIVAGVCSGLAAYFGIDVLWVRVGFVVLTLVNGLGLLAYIILWLVVPRAETRAEEFEMQGRTITVAEIQEAIQAKAKNMQEEGEEVLARLRADDSAVRKIATIPVVVIGSLFRGVKKIVGAVLPILGTIVGIFILGGSVIAMVALAIGLGLLLFGVRSPYIVSDFPLAELAGRPLYYVGSIGLFFVLFLPLVFLVSVGRTLVQRKNVFTMRGIAIVGAFWLISLSAGAMAASDLVPLMYGRMEVLAQEKNTRSFGEQDFTKIKIDLAAPVQVQQGAGFAITFTGRPERLERIKLQVENGELLVTESEDRTNKCLFCSPGELSGLITLPKLDSLVARGDSSPTLEWFTGNLMIDLHDAARAQVMLSADTVTTTLRDVSRVTFQGKAQTMYALLEDATRMVADGVSVGNLTLIQSHVSRAGLSGEVGRLTGELKDVAVLDASELKTGQAALVLRDSSRAEVAATELLDASVFDIARLRYRSGVATTNFKKQGQGSISPLERQVQSDTN